MDMVGEDPLGFVTKEVGLLDQMIEICRLAIEANLSFDPHFRNFTVREGKVFYVDIFPPLIDDYFKLFSLLGNPELNRREWEHYALFHPKAVAQHFLADWLKVYNNEQVLEAVADRMKVLDLIAKIDRELIQTVIQIENQNHADPEFWLM
jgi:hypothetical protein